MVTVKVGNWSFGIGSKTHDGRTRPLALVIIDGWGHSNEVEGNAIALANTPNYDKLCANYPQTLLAAAGPRVGLLPDSPGNSEIGHLNLGMGRVAQTERTMLMDAVRSGSFFENPTLKRAFATARRNESSVHLIGMVSDGNAESSMDTLFSLLRMAKDENCGERVFVHGILDGRDVPEYTADVYIEALQIKMADIGCGRLATLCGRDYAMDVERDWTKTVRAYTMLVHSEGERAFDAVSAIRGSYLRGNTDAHVQPIVIEKVPGVPLTSVKDGDVVVFFNHGADGMHQLVTSLALEDTNGSGGRKPKIHPVCIVEYERSFRLPVAFRAEKESNPLGKVFADHGVGNCRLAESEKSEHITYFFNGEREVEHPGEKRVIVPSLNGVNGTRPKLPCFEITRKLLRGLEKGEDEVFIVSLAAADLCARTGNLEKTIEAVELVDKCLGEIIGKVHEVDGVALITSDHGNCEEMLASAAGKPRAHTSNPVPFHFVANDLNGLRLRNNGALEDVAPTILGILGIEKPFEMTGKDLRLN